MPRTHTDYSSAIVASGTISASSTISTSGNISGGTINGSSLGTNNSIIGGSTNTNTEARAIVLAGICNKITGSGTNGAIAGGKSLETSRSCSFMGGGCNNTITNGYANAIIGGAFNSCTHGRSAICGGISQSTAHAYELCCQNFKRSGTDFSTSDLNLKKNIIYLDDQTLPFDPITLIKNVKPVTFQWKTQYDCDPVRHIGFIAQDLAAETSCCANDSVFPTVLDNHVDVIKLAVSETTEGLSGDTGITGPPYYYNKYTSEIVDVSNETIHGCTGPDGNPGICYVKYTPEDHLFLNRDSLPILPYLVCQRQQALIEDLQAELVLVKARLDALEAT